MVKLVSTASSATDAAIFPNKVESPTETTTAVAVPEIILLPIKAILLYSVIFSFFSWIFPNFSIGSLSPVKLAWLTNKSFASKIRTSAGIMSPADK